MPGGALWKITLEHLQRKIDNFLIRGNPSAEKSHGIYMSDNYIVCTMPENVTIFNVICFYNYIIVIRGVYPAIDVKKIFSHKEQQTTVK